MRLYRRAAREDRAASACSGARPPSTDKADAASSTSSIHRPLLRQPRDGLLLVAVLASLISGHERSGGQLLLKALTVWSTNAITFGLWFWAIDRGGPYRRLEPDPPPPDFLFPQVTEPEVAERGWYPRLFDSLYI